MQTIQCPKCPATFDAKYVNIAHQHSLQHARLERNHAERVAADAACRAAHGRPRGTKYAQAEMFTYLLGRPVIQGELF